MDASRTHKLLIALHQRPLGGAVPPDNHTCASGGRPVEGAADDRWSFRVSPYMLCRFALTAQHLVGADHRQDFARTQLIVGTESRHRAPAAQQRTVDAGCREWNEDDHGGLASRVSVPYRPPGAASRTAARDRTCAPPQCRCGRPRAPAHSAPAVPAPAPRAPGTAPGGRA